MTVVSNSSPLIYLAKAGRLRLLKDLFGTVLLPGAVMTEVVEKGLLLKAPDSVIVAQAIMEKWLKTVKTEPLHKLSEIAFELDIGETEAIALARKERATLLLIDDAAARRIAESYGIKVRGTLYVVLLALEKRLLTKPEAKHAVNSLVQSGFRIAPELYGRILSEIEKQ